MADNLNLKLILFPLFVMFLMTVVQVDGDTEAWESGDFSTISRRDVTDSQAEYFDNYVQSAYDNFGENPGKVGIAEAGISGGGDWRGDETQEFYNDLREMMDRVFGEATGHTQVIYRLRVYMDGLYQDNASRVTENDVRYNIGFSPEGLEEMEELSGSGINYGSTLAFVGVFIGILALAGIVGIRILGSGLAETSIGFIVKLTSFLLIWGLFSLLTMNYLGEIPLVGALIWVLLTFMYMSGVFLTLSGGD